MAITAQTQRKNWQIHRDEARTAVFEWLNGVTPSKVEALTLGDLTELVETVTRLKIEAYNEGEAYERLANPKGTPA